MIEIIDEMMIVIVIVHLVIKILVYLDRNHPLVQKIENNHLVHHQVHLLHPVLDQILRLPHLLRPHLHHPVHHQVVHLDRKFLFNLPIIHLIFFYFIENLHRDVKNLFELHPHANVYQLHRIPKMKISL